MESRRIPGTDIDLSALGAAIPPTVRPGPPDVMQPGLVLKAEELGYTFVDCSTSSTVEAAELLVGSVAHQRPLEVRVGIRLDILHAIPPGSHGLQPATPAPAGPAIRGPSFDLPAVRAVLSEHLHRLRREAADVVLLAGTAPVDFREGSLPATLDSLKSEGRVGAWGIYLGRGEDGRDVVAPSCEAGATVVSVVHNLFVRSPLGALAAGTQGKVGFLARDPHAEGRLDGSFIHAGPNRPPENPLSIDQLQARLGPVTALGFLTEDRRRTLGQAAIQFTLAEPTVVSVETALVSALQLEEWAAATSRPPLSAEQLRKIATLPESVSRPDLS